MMTPEQALLSNIQERLLKLENNLQEQIKLNNTHVERIQSFFDEITWSEDLKRMNDYIDKIKFECIENGAKPFHRLDAMGQRWTEAFESLKKRLVSFEGEFAIFSADSTRRFDSLDANVIELKKNLENLAAEQKSVKNVLEKRDDEQKHVLKRFEEISKEISTLKALASAHDYHISVLQQKNNEIEVNYVKALQDLTDRVRNVQREVNALIKDTVDRLTAKITEKLSAPIVSDSGRIEEVRKELLKRVDDFSIEIQNAIIRSQNNETALKQADKKFENIYLLIKKAELDKK